LNWKTFLNLFFFPFFCWIWDPGWKKIRIRDKHSGYVKQQTGYETGLQDTHKENSRDHGDKKVPKLSPTSFTRQMAAERVHIGRGPYFFAAVYWTPLPPLSRQLARQATQREEILAVIAGGGGETNKTTAIRLANIFPFLSPDKTNTFAS
jgi:hypothetical protein